MKNTPNKIYLNHGSDANDFNELTEVTWCKDRVHKNDLEFISVDFILARIEGLKELRKNKLDSGIFGDDDLLRGAIAELVKLLK